MAIHVREAERRPDDLRSRLVAARAAVAAGSAGAANARPLPRAAAVRPMGSTAVLRPRLRRGQGDAPAAPPPAVVAANRMGFGPRPGDLEAFAALGGSDAARLEAYVEQQLHPGAIDDSDCDHRLAAAGFTTLGKSRDKLWADHVAANPSWDVRIQPAVETERATFLRALYSRRQLLEVLVQFWHDHFNVYGWDDISAPMWVQYDRDVIRANALGNFRTMLGAVAESPAMLDFLNNDVNQVAGPNENWARELFELHTLGVESYLGVRHQSQVPLDGGGVPIGFVDDDVYESTRCFTGWTLDNKTGATVFDSDWHDRFQKAVLGRFMPPYQAPFKDGRDVLDALATHPGTAGHVAAKLARRLIADEPPSRVVSAAAATFLAARDAPDQLLQVVRTILLAPEFAATWGGKVKRPFELTVSALRATGAEMSFAMKEDFTDSFLWLFGNTGHARFAWRAPNGYSDLARDWLSTGTLVESFRLLNWVIAAQDDAKRPVVDVAGQTPAGTDTADGIADFWIARVFGRALPPAARAEVVDFMAQGRDPDVPLRLDESDVSDRVVAMVALLTMAPDFLWR